MGRAQKLSRRTAVARPKSIVRKTTAPSAIKGREFSLKKAMVRHKEVTLSRGQRKRAAIKENFRQKATFAEAMAGVKRPIKLKSNPYFGFEPVQGGRVGPISAKANAEAGKAFAKDMQATAIQQAANEASREAPVSAMQKPRYVRDGIEVEEVAQLKAVVNHVNYQANPFAALQYHLHSTLPPPEKPKRIKHKKQPKQNSSNRRGR